MINTKAIITYALSSDVLPSLWNIKQNSLVLYCVVHPWNLDSQQSFEVIGNATTGSGGYDIPWDSCSTNKLILISSGFRRKYCICLYLQLKHDKGSRSFKVVHYSNTGSCIKTVRNLTVTTALSGTVFNSRLLENATTPYDGVWLPLSG